MGKRTTNVLKNVTSGMLLKMGTLFLSFLSRVFFIRFLGEACLGLNGLFTTILSLFSLADLGIGDAIIYYMYKPIAEKNEQKLCQLISFYKFCYRIIGVGILIIGISLIPFLPNIVNLDIEVEYNLYLIYVLYLLNTVVTYIFFSYSLNVLTANQQQYIINNINIIFSVLIFIGDLLTLSVTHDYIVYLIVRILLVIAQNYITFLIARKKYKYISCRPVTRITKAEIKEMFKDVYSIFVVKLSSRLIESTDNIFISVFLNTIIVGYHSNYLMFVSAAISLTYVFIYSFGAGVGDLAVVASKKELVNYYEKIDFLNFCVSFAGGICLFSFLNPFISILWGTEFTFSILTSAFISFNFYITTSLYTTFVFRQSLGLFKYYRYNMLFTAITNLILDFIFVNYFGVMGLYLATIIANLVFGVWPFIINVYEKGFEISAKKQIRKIIIRYFYFIVTCLFVYWIGESIPNNVLGFIVRVFLTLCIIVILILISGIFDSQFKQTILFFKCLVKGRKHDKR